MPKAARRFLLFSSNWDNAGKAGVAYLNSNNVTSNVNSSLGSHLELMATALSCISPEQHFNLHLLEGRTHSSPKKSVGIVRDDSLPRQGLF